MCRGHGCIDGLSWERKPKIGTAWQRAPTRAKNTECTDGELGGFGSFVVVVVHKIQGDWPWGCAEATVGTRDVAQALRPELLARERQLECAEL